MDGLAALAQQDADMGVPQGMPGQEALAELDPAGGQGQAPEDVVREIMYLIAEGATPDELAAQGFPEELVQLAIEIIMSADSAGEPEAADEAEVPTGMGLPRP